MALQRNKELQTPLSVNAFISKSSIDTPIVKSVCNMFHEISLTDALKKKGTSGKLTWWRREKVWVKLTLPCGETRPTQAHRLRTRYRPRILRLPLPCLLKLKKGQTIWILTSRTANWNQDRTRDSKFDWRPRREPHLCILLYLLSIIILCSFSFCETLGDSTQRVERNDPNSRFIDLDGILM